MAERVLLHVVVELLLAIVGVGSAIGASLLWSRMSVLASTALELSRGLDQTTVQAGT